MKCFAWIFFEKPFFLSGTAFTVATALKEFHGIVSRREVEPNIPRKQLINPDSSWDRLFETAWEIRFLILYHFTKNRSFRLLSVTMFEIDCSVPAKHDKRGFCEWSFFFWTVFLIKKVQKQKNTLLFLGLHYILSSRNNIKRRILLAS
jgi:hypothetical protein